MDAVTLFSVLALVYIGLLFWLNLGRKNSETEETFTIAGRNVSKYVTAASLSTGVRDASGIVVWITFSILYGFNSLIIVVGMFLAWFLLSFSAKKVHALAKEKNYVTFSDYVRGEIGSFSSIVISILTIATAFFFAAAQLNVSGEIVSRIYDIPLAWSIASVTVVVFAYLLFGGYGSVVKTDYLQWFLIIASLAIINIALFTSTSSGINLTGITSPDFTLLWGIAAIGFLSIYGAPDAWQRIFSSRSENDAKQGFALGSVFFLAITVLLVLAGTLVGSVLGGLPEGNPLFVLFELEVVSGLVVALFGMFIVTAMMSTLDTQSFLLAQTVAKNFLPQQNQKRLIRWILLALLIGLGLVAFTILDIIAFLFSAVGIISIVAPVMILYNLGTLSKIPKADKFVAFSMLVGLAVFIYLFATGALQSILLNLVPALVTFGLLVVGLLFGFVRKA